MDAIQRAQLQAQRRGRITVPKTLSAPLKGWNTRDPFEAMDPLDAVQLDNWYPDFAGLVVRGGSLPYIPQGQLGAAPVQTLARFVRGATEKFLAAASGQIWDITNPAGSLSLGSGFGSDIWQTVFFNTRLFFVNGHDTPQIYDGSSLSPSTFTGLLTSTLSGIGAFHNRLFFWTGSDQSFWYGVVNGIAGVLTNFDLSMVTQSGGNLVSVAVLSYDGGTGIAAYTCFFMSSGEVILYQGTDPSNANNWSLAGIYTIAAPVAQRAITRYGGDIFLTTANDHQELSKLLIALKLGETPPRTKISGAAKSAYLQGKGLPGWQALYYPAGTRIIYNIPNLDGTFSQHIYNTSTQAWCRFTGNDAYCFGLFEDNLFFGADNGSVVQANTGTTDSGIPIVALAQQAWNTFESPLKKRVTAVRPVVQSDGVSDFGFSLGFDYQPANPATPDATVTASQSMIWGVSVWGAPTLWGGSGVTDPRWHIASGEGAAISMDLVANTKIGATWLRTDFLIEPGSNL